MTLRPCLDCGDPTDAGTRCPDCRPPDHQLSAHRRGYDAAWTRLSRHARRLQPWCTDCGATEDLTTDHSPEAWRTKAKGRAITLAMVTVVCRSCNGKRGKARPDDDKATPGRPPSKSSGPLGKAQSPLHTRPLRHADVAGRADHGPGPRINQHAAGVDICLAEFDNPSVREGHFCTVDDPNDFDVHSPLLISHDSSLS